MFPPLPVVQNDTALAIFEHSSVRSSGHSNRFGDAGRLALLGRKVLHMVLVESLFEKRPMLDGDELNNELENTLSDVFYEQWVSYYKLREKVACTPDHRSELLEPRMTRRLFDAYVGAVYAEQGYSGIKAWIRRLLDPSLIVGPYTGVSTSNPPPPLLVAPQFSHLPLGYGNGFLAVFNQAALHHRVRFEWIAVRSGPSHEPTWSVDCITSGIVRGTGSGPSKKCAKEQAARQAYQVMGWAAGAYR